MTRQVGSSLLTSTSNRVQLNKHLIRSNTRYVRNISRSEACTHVGNPECHNPSASHHLVGRAAALLRRVNPQDEALVSRPVDTSDLYRSTLTNNTNNRPSIINTNIFGKTSILNNTDAGTSFSHNSLILTTAR